MVKAFRIALVLVSLGVASALVAVEVGGVAMPATEVSDGKTLKLNGAGVRKKVIFKVYTAGLYLEKPSRDAAAILSADEHKVMRLHVLRSLKGEKLSAAISEGFERNSKDQIPKLAARLEKLKQMIPDVAENDVILFAFLPDKGVRVTVRGTDRGTIEGRDFADALLSIWLGPNPVQEDLKKALLGG